MIGCTCLWLNLGRGVTDLHLFCLFPVVGHFDGRIVRDHGLCDDDCWGSQGSCTSWHDLRVCQKFETSLWRGHHGRTLNVIQSWLQWLSRPFQALKSLHRPYWSETWSLSNSHLISASPQTSLELFWWRWLSWQTASQTSHQTLWSSRLSWTGGDEIISWLLLWRFHERLDT